MGRDGARSSRVGHCERTFAEMPPEEEMSIDVSVDVLIARPVAQVAEFVIEPTNEPRWIKGIQESVPLMSGPIAVGAKVRRVATFVGRQIEYTPTVERYERDKLLAMRTDQPFPMTIEYIFEDDTGGTRFTQRLRGGPAGVAALFSPLMAIMVRRNVRGDMQRLKQLLEAS
jgi:hypothetical protein